MLAGADQSPSAVEWNNRTDDFAGQGLAPGQEPQSIPAHLHQAHALPLHKKPPIRNMNVLRRASRSPDLHAPAGAAKNAFLGAEIDGILDGDGAVNILEIPIGLRDFIAQGDKAEAAGCICSELAKVAYCADEDAIVHHAQGTHSAPVQHADTPPRNAVVDQDAAGVAEIHEAALILHDRKILRTTAVIFRAEVPDIWQAGLLPDTGRDGSTLSL